MAHPHLRMSRARLLMAAGASAALLTGPLALHAGAQPQVFAQVPAGATVSPDGVIADVTGSVIGVLEGTPAADPIDDAVDAVLEATAPVVEAAEPVTQAAEPVTEPALEAAAPVVEAVDEAITPVTGGPVVAPVTEHVTGGGQPAGEEAPPPPPPPGGGAPSGAPASNGGAPSGNSGSGGGGTVGGVTTGSGATATGSGGAVSSQSSSTATPVQPPAADAPAAVAAAGTPGAALAPSLGAVAGGITSFIGSSTGGGLASSSLTLQPLPPMVATPFEYLSTAMSDVVAPAVADAEAAGQPRIQLSQPSAELAADVVGGGSRPASVVAAALLGLAAAAQVAIRRYAPLGVWQR